MTLLSLVRHSTLVHRTAQELVKMMADREELDLSTAIYPHSPGCWFLFQPWNLHTSA